MNKKAENFQAYLKEKGIDSFVFDEPEGNDREIAIFRSHIVVEGQQLPTIVMFDNTIFSIIRVQISPQAVTDENAEEVLSFLNEENAKYKPFKIYCAPDGSIIFDICFTNPGEEIDGDLIYTFFNIAINYLNENYRTIMKKIW